MRKYNTIALIFLVGQELLRQSQFHLQISRSILLSHLLHFVISKGELRQ
jgi:hypothetical protein